MSLSPSKLQDLIKGCRLPIYTDAGQMLVNDIERNRSVSPEVKLYLNDGGRLSLMLYDPYIQKFRMVGIGHQFTLAQVLFAARWVEVSLGESSHAHDRVWLAAGAQIIEDGKAEEDLREELIRLEFFPNRNVDIFYAAPSSRLVKIEDGIDWSNLGRDSDFDFKGSLRSPRLSSNWVLEQLMVVDGVVEYDFNLATQVSDYLLSEGSIEGITPNTCFILSVPNTDSGSNNSCLVCDQSTFGLARAIYAARIIQEQAGNSINQSKQPLLIAQFAEEDCEGCVVESIHFHSDGHMRFQLKGQESREPFIVELNEL